MITKLINKFVDAGTDVHRRISEGKITLAEGEKELRMMGMQLTQSMIEGQVKLNLADAQSNDRFRTWWRPAACWMLVIAVGLIVALLFAVAVAAACGYAPEPGWADTVLALLEKLLLVLTAAMGIREGGKAWGNG